MGFLKLGEPISISKIEEYNPESPIIDDDVVDDFKKTAQHLKKIAPKAKDFLYFVATIIHAAEASAYNENGEPKLTKSGEPVSVGWDKDWRWISNDESIKPYRNANHDIFPESALLEVVAGEDIPAYKKWVGKPLCIDHKSSSVDHVRGFIVDTYYDAQRKRVVALCALDKINFPDLARKVSTGYSNNVSMGTGVSTAVCTDCLRQAKTEADFCNHMRTKNSYGEINLGLNPIELSIVVTPADAKAKIKHVIASMQNYLNLRNEQIKSAKTDFHFNLGSSSSESDDTNNLNFGGSYSSVDDLEAEILESLKILKETMHKDKSEDIDSSAADSLDDTQTFEVSSISPPVARFASQDDSLALMNRLHQLESNFFEMKDKFNQLTSNKEKEMSGKLQNRTAYFQGGGGVNEPTPGKRKYEVESENEDLRSEDKHMKVEPNSMGGDSGMHPGVKSVPMSELERKKMLARAELEDRAMRRAAALESAKASLEKSSYFQGGGDVNEPTPGKRKYEVDPLNEKLRKEDKHMVGQKPFPGVGDVDGLHPSPESADEKDELKRKQKLSRAGYKATFHKKASEGDSVWRVSNGDKVVFAATVDQLTDGKADLFYNQVATKEFGAKLMSKVVASGPASIKIKKVSQELPEAPPAEPAAPAPEATPEVSQSMDVKDMDMGGDGDPKEQLKVTLEKIQELSSDAIEAFRALADEKAEMGDAPLTASAYNKALFKLRKELHGELSQSFREVIAELKDYEAELTTLADVHAKGLTKQAQKEVLADSTKSALADARAAIADGFELMGAFTSYLRSTQAILKKAEAEEAEAADEYSADDLTAMLGDGMQAEDMESDDADPMLSADDIHSLDSDLADLDSMMDDDWSADDEQSGEDDSDASDEEDSDDADDMDAVVQTPDGTKVELKDGTKVVSASFDLTTPAGRKAYRAKLASEALEMSSLLHDAHKHDDQDLDLEYKTELAHIETLEEQHDAMMETLAHTAKVKKEAETIRQLVAEGSLDESDLDELVARGLDKEALDYYKKYFSQTEGGSEFAAELVKEHVKAEMQKDLELHKAKVQRAFALANKMASRGMCAKTESGISTQVDQLMTFDDVQFNAIRQMVENQPVKTATAGVMPQVGISNGLSESDSSSLVDQLSGLFSTPGNRRQF